MLALQAWSCSVLAFKHAKTFRVLCKMNGACLGSIPDEASKTCAQRLRCLQLRASKLMPHATRTPRYLKLYVKGCLITPKEFVYKTWLTKEQLKLAKHCLGAADSLSIVWDEDDAEAVLAVQKSCVTYGKVLSCKFKNRSDIRVMALNTSHKYTMLCVASTSMTVDRLYLLEGFSNITNLTLENIIPGDWTVLKRLSCLEHLAVEQTQESEASCYDLMFDVLASMPTFESLALKNTPDMSHKIASLQGLKQLELHNTHFDFAQLPSKIASLNATRVSCKPYKLPPSLFRSLLTNLSIQHGVHMSGSIPSEVGLARQLRYLNLSDNNLEGSIPTEVGSLGLLKLLNLSCNKLGGTIPSELGKASSLLNVNLSHNNLTNFIPCQLGELAYLVYLDLSYNKLTGQVPPELGELQLRSFRTVQNRLCPSLPSTLIHNKVYYGDSF